MKKSRIIFFLILILGIQLLLRIPFLAEPMEGDEGAYAYMAQGLLQGEVLYQDTFDHKPPGIYFIYAAIFKLFGESLAVLRYFTAFYSLVTTLAVFIVAAMLLGSSGGLIAALFYAIFSNGPFLEGTSSNSEVFMILPMILAFLFCLAASKRKSLLLFFLAGFLAGLAGMIKQVAFFNFAVLFGFAFFDPDSENKLMNIASLILGFFVPVFGFSLYFLAQGAFKEFLHNSFLINFLYIRPFVGVVNIEWGTLNLYRIAYLFLEESILFILGTYATVYILLRNRKKNALLLVFWAFSSCLGVLIGRYLFGHYFVQLLPPLAILSAYAVIKWKESHLPLKINVLLIGFFTLLGLVIILTFYKFYVVYSPDEISYARYRIDNLSLAREAAQIVEGRTSPSDNIMVWGTDPQVYFYSKRRYPGRYIYLPFHFPDLFKEACLEAERMVDGKRVQYIILARPVYEELFAQIEKSYRFVLSKEGRYHGKTVKWGIFELK